MAMILKIGRKMIVDYIEGGKDQDFDDWKKVASTGGLKNFLIGAFLPQKQDNSCISMRLVIPIPNCKFNDIFEYITNTERRLIWDENLQSIEVKKELPIETKLVHVLLKSAWPMGARDILMNQHQVRYQDKAWIINHSVEDEDYPEQKGITRVDLNSGMFHLKPNPEIHGYTVIVDSEFNFGGKVPKSVV